MPITFSYVIGFIFCLCGCFILIKAKQTPAKRIGYVTISIGAVIIVTATIAIYLALGTMSPPNSNVIQP